MSRLRSSLLLIGVFLVFPVLVHAADKYTVQQRFGAVMQDGYTKKITDFSPKKIGLGWYENKTHINVTNAPEFVGMVSPYTKEAPSSPSDPVCNTMRSQVASMPQNYPNKMMWIVGNNIGLDDKRTPDEYADAFTKWYTCLKNINNTFQVGTGAALSFRHNTFPNQGACVDINNAQSGKSYFTQIINKIKALDSTKVPDFITLGGYLWCHSGGFSKANLATMITEYRQTMKDLGLQNKDLIIKEIGAYDPAMTYDTRQQFMRDAVDYFMTASNANLGNPSDNNRLVQRFAWAPLNNMQDNDYLYERYSALTNFRNGELTPLGDMYREMVFKYTNNSRISIDRFGYGGFPQYEQMQKLGLYAARVWIPDDPILPIWIIRGADTYFNVGKFDNSDYISRNGTFNGKFKCKDPAANNTIKNCSDIPTTGIPNDISYDLISTLATQNKSMAYEISNEPDWGPYSQPEEYAVWFHLFSKEILRKDPTAKIMVGGLIVPVGQGVYESAGNQSRDPTLINRLRAITGNSSYPANRYNWVDLFRYKYKAVYGEFPRIDIWAIHPYEFTNSYNGSIKATNVINNVKAFRIYLESLPEGSFISERNKPIYFTEYGILGYEGELGKGSGCTTAHGLACQTKQQQEAEWDQINAFTRPIVDWYADPNNNVYAQKLFWYIWQDKHEISDAEYFSIMKFGYFDTVAEPLPIAMVYAKRARSASLFNPSFEVYRYNNLPYDEWYLVNYGPISSGYSIGMTTAEKHTGNASVKLVTGNQTTSSVYQSIVTQEIRSNYYNGKQIQLTAWCKTAAGANATIRISRKDMSGAVSWLPGTPGLVSCPAWQKLQTTVATVPLDTTGLLIEGIVNGQSATGYFDDFSLSVVESTCAKKSLGDANCDGAVSLADFEIWRGEFTGSKTTKDSDFDGSDSITLADFEKWRGTMTTQ